jgi:uncharacterized protein
MFDKRNVYILTFLGFLTACLNSVVIAEDRQTTLIDEESGGNLRTSRQLIANAADVNAKNDKGQTALMMASEDLGCRDYSSMPMSERVWRKKTIISLLEEGADINAKDNSGNTALIMASQGNTCGSHYRETESVYKEIVESLLVKGADVNAQTDYGETALMVAIEQGYGSPGHWEVIELLIASKNINVNAQAKENGQTALMMLVKNPSINFKNEKSENIRKKCVELLLHKGADVNATNKNSETALMLALDGYIYEEDSRKKMLWEINDSKVFHKLAHERLNILNKHREIVKLLLAKGADVQAQDKNGNTALARALEAKSEEIVALLRNVGAKK